MASTSAVHPLWPIPALCYRPLVLFSTMEDNDNRAITEDSFHLCPTLSLTVFVSVSLADAPIWLCSHLSFWLLISLLLSWAQAGGGMWGFKLYKLMQNVSPSMNTKRMSLHSQVFIYRLPQYKGHCLDPFHFILTVKLEHFNAAEQSFKNSASVIMVGAVRWC